MISEQTIEKVLSRADIQSVVKDYVTTMSTSGVNYKALCPFHKEKTPSFIISPSKNICKCFSCGKGGNPAHFLMEIEGLSFPQAIKKLAGKYGIEVEETCSERSPEENKLRKKRESAFIIMDAACKFYEEQILQDDPDAKAALAYANMRWNKHEDGTDDDKDFRQVMRVGWAGKNRRALSDFLNKNHYNMELALEIGLVCKSKFDNGYYDFYNNRVMIPIRDKWGNIESFTARSMEDIPNKYVNGENSFIFNKQECLFGIDIARMQAIKEQKMYLVEGGPDAISMQAIGASNTVAALGTAWGKKLKVLKGIMKGGTVCFIPDSDRKAGQSDLECPGIRAVIKQEKKEGKIILKGGAAEAIRLGFRVTVKEIPQDDDGKKQDADSYITSVHVLDSIREEDFFIWYGQKVFTGQENASERYLRIKMFTDLLIYVQDEVMRNTILESLAARFGVKKTWRDAIKQSERELRIEKDAEKAKERDIDSEQYGFIEENNCIFQFGNADKMWANFIIRPKFHIKDPNNSKRIYELTNYKGEKAIIEMKEGFLYSLQQFRTCIGSYGNYLFKVGPEELNRLVAYLYDNTETATEVKQLGWQKGGFWCWGNGIVKDGKFIEVDEDGICRIDIHKDGKLLRTDNYYLPAMSKIYSDQRELFFFERKFVFEKRHANINLHDYAQMMCDVFGDNAKVGLMFLLATLFRDVITSYTKNFPLLNLFGPKGSGKSELGHTLMSFFISDNDPINIVNSTKPSLNATIAQCANALVHVDEYKNNIDPDKIEFLKGLYDGVGRSRLNMDLDKKRETTKVDSGVILSGQEMPTADIALFSRTIFLTFDTTSHTLEETRLFNRLAELRKQGVSHLTNEIIKCYGRFESRFYTEYKSVLEDIGDHIDRETEVRIWRDWATILSAYKCLYKDLDLPWSYDEMKKITVDGIRRQNQACVSSNELGLFWDAVENMASSSIIFEDGDYKIKEMRKLKTNVVNREWSINHRVLMIIPKNIIRLYKIEARKSGDKPMSEGSIKYYLQTCPGYLGQKGGSERFKVFDNNGVPKRKLKKGSTTEWEVMVKFTNPLCFDYEVLQERFDLNLDVVSTSDITQEQLDNEYDVPEPKEQMLGLKV